MHKSRTKNPMKLLLFVHLYETVFIRFVCRFFFFSCSNYASICKIKARKWKEIEARRRNNLVLLHCIGCGCIKYILLNMHAVNDGEKKNKSRKIFCSCNEFSIQMFFFSSKFPAHFLCTPAESGPSLWMHKSKSVVYSIHTIRYMRNVSARA